ncbi:4-hydroxy-tetrahydrodipicolinate reductase [Pukyongia salina]|uniref:4-hydroxy-tetrahydrodipicolinate reductase n=1 Tax=Pukyongia salina TaxID=2094025 RepID=A0A2S0HSW0_9FLAO|nr:4-hydroxy-tetrahydrodipicolinate reductase [Pukyongia salina]AVI49746.1 4-hydroxy-tetrahydrodipicolinate reductase [Pukyongia salina]
MKLALLGYGKMGKTIERLAVEAGHEVVFIKDRANERGDLAEADVAIDFSTPEAAIENISRCIMDGIPIVSGTTGWLKDYDKVLNLCEERNGSFIYASNFSIGVNLFFGLNEYLAKQMSSWPMYDINIEEIHHTEKKDAPSGTAISLAEGIIKNTAKEAWQLDGQGDAVVPIHAKREEDVKGTHEITYSSEIDTISIKHEAHSRDGFAKGAILAAQWLQNKKGVFGMKDVLGIE